MVNNIFLRFRRALFLGVFLESLCFDLSTFLFVWAQIQQYNLIHKVRKKVAIVFLDLLLLPPRPPTSTPSPYLKNAAPLAQVWLERNFWKGRNFWIGKELKNFLNIIYHLFWSYNLRHFVLRMHSRFLTLLTQIIVWTNITLNQEIVAENLI